MEEELIIENLNLVRFLMKKNFGTTFNEELFQIGCVGLVKAGKKFDKNRNVKFTAYASFIIENEWKQHYRDQRKIINAVSLEEPIADKLTIADTLVDKNIQDGLYVKEIFSKTIEKLSDRDKRIVKLDICGINQKDIAKELKISQPQVSRVMNKFREKIKKEYKP